MHTEAKRIEDEGKNFQRSNGSIDKTTHGVVTNKVSGSLPKKGILSSMRAWEAKSDQTGVRSQDLVGVNDT
ncbi:hypothetical protein PDE_01886 [Penicillium oxalicum 114-2]|uniref:Uncharacterized protein n=1 Tax=Penicillium oxalicum (strain 114-2 / CGMCC 5302) TaxID=933388 RepID=S7ZE34_PENO1|nr:hypothetical protein PDE_01886 [Penicillium oxalicum 114-2]